MKSTNTTTTNNTTNTTSWTPANTWTFTPASVCVNGRELPAEYSLARTGDVYVFAKLGDLPVRMHVGVDMPMYADCLAAAKLAAQAAKAAKASAPAPVQDAPKPAPVQAPAKAQDKPAQAPKAAKAPKAPKVPAPAKAQDKPAPVQDAPKPAPVQDMHAAIVAKPWIGTTIDGNGWRIAFDQAAQRTRVVFDGAPTDAQKAAVLGAGFFWSAAMGSYNKHLTAKAFRAAQALAAALNALA
ncbi:MAG: hypothetical protein IJ523_10735 [Succinivibrionaceae bacterium]|nr:hypothetical protein [Succinivibrionaceae bacterium]